MGLEDWHRLGWLPGRCYIRFRECSSCCRDTHFSFGLGLGCWQPEVQSSFGVSFAKRWNTGKCVQSTYSLMNLMRLIHFVKLYSRLWMLMGHLYLHSLSVLEL